MFDIQRYMPRGVMRVVADSLRATATNGKERRFMAGFAKNAASASARRRKAEKAGEHIPPFLICSITSSCNLHCAGCYARENHACSDEPPQALLTAQQWNGIFTEAEELGISFILLAGGEPLLRRDVIETAAKHPSILFPIFTNGVFLKGKYIELLDKYRNLLPIVSIEGDEKTTDSRRGEGVYGSVTKAMEGMRDAGITFGASVTVTTENLREVYSDAFLDGLYALGCRAVIYVEYVPVTDESADLAPGESEQKYMREEVKRLRRKRRGMVFISFPGDEKSSGGCVAAGRGFFHINAHGGAEPCPFSPYSDINVIDSSLRGALRSPLFKALQTQGLLQDDHIGGCTLYMNKDKVEAIVNGKF